ncbi:MAG: LysE family translocator [Pseudomonadota bacterium]
MSPETWIAYVAALTVLSVIPGPSVLLVVGQALAKGLRGAFSCVAGDLLGGVVMMTAAFIGLGTVLAASSELYLVIKWAGVAYMVWLGLAQFRAARSLREADLQQPARSLDKRSFRAGFFTGILNPKAVLFYLAFLAQFIDPTNPLMPQFLILMATSTAVVCVVLGGYAILAVRVRRVFQSLRARRRLG